MAGIQTFMEKNDPGHDASFSSPSHRVTYTCKVSGAHRAKLIVLSEYFSKKRSPLASELLESAIDDVFERVSVNPDIQERYFHARIQLGLDEPGADYQGEPEFYKSFPLNQKGE